MSQQERKSSLLYKKISPNAQAPRRSNPGDAGYDVFACWRAVMKNNSELQHDPRVRWVVSRTTGQFSMVVPPGARCAIPTGVAVACQPDTVFQVWPRSGLALKQGIDVLAGVVDSGYRNEVVCILINHGTEDFIVEKGDKVCQMLPVSLSHHDSLQLEEVSELPPSNRGFGGFGSTGNR